MSSTHSVRAIVLKTYDVGEADRFCVLFTREIGRVAAKATGTRRLKSRLGGVLLPFSSVIVQLKESSIGYIISGAVRSDQDLSFLTDIAAFARAQEAVELLLALTVDEDPFPELFDAAEEFFRSCRHVDSADHTLSFTFRLLSLLGFLPQGEEMDAFAELSEEERRFIEASASGTLRTPPPGSSVLLRSLCKTLIAQQIHWPMKVPGFAERLK